MFGILPPGDAANVLMPVGILIGACLLMAAFAARALLSRRRMIRDGAAALNGDQLRARARDRVEDDDPDGADADDGEGLFFVAGDTVQDVNRSIRVILGLADDDIVGARLGKFFPPDCYSDLQRLMKDRQGVIETQISNAGGGRRDVEVIVRPPPPERPDLSVLGLRDITDRKAAERKNQIVVLTDPLTGAGNRILYHERLRQAVDWAQRSQTCIAVISVDIDRLDLINQRMGYTVGHGVLFEVAARLFAATRQTDTVARMAETEFAVIVTSLNSSKDILTVALRLLKRLSEPYVIDGKTIDVSPRSGIALYPDDTGVTESLITFARRSRLRAARDTTDGLCFFTPEMNKVFRERISLMDELGVAAERHQLEPHFEGIFDIRTLEICGYHASLRWQHPARGVLLPDAFVPVAEASGDVHRLGDWELEQACAYATALSTPTTISLDVSAVRLRREDPCKRMLGILDRWRVPPQGLELEIADKLLDNNADAVFAHLAAFKAAGMRVALVHGMTSGVSLAHHERFAFDTIKLDRSLSASINTDEIARKKSAMIMAVAKSLGAEGVAAGVATREQLVTLAKLGCRRVQGPVLHHLARSGAVKAAGERLTERV